MWDAYPVPCACPLMPACYSLEWQESQANNGDEYSSRVRRYRDQPAAGAFAHFGYRGDQGEGWETPCEKLARMSKGGRMGLSPKPVQTRWPSLPDSHWLRSEEHTSE